MALTAMGPTFQPPRLPQQSFPQPSFSQSPFVGPTDKWDRRVVAGHVKGAGSEVFDIQQYENERADQRKRDMILPSPETSPVRPKTAPSNSRPQFSEYKPMEYNRSYKSPEPNPFF